MCELLLTDTEAKLTHQESFGEFGSCDRLSQVERAGDWGLVTEN